MNASKKKKCHFCQSWYTVTNTGWILLEQGLKSVSVDESFAVASGLLNLVEVLVNDVKQHSLERATQRKTWVEMSCGKDLTRWEA